MILSSIKKRIWKTTHKYGVEIPTSIKHAYEVDARNNDHLWRDAIKKEMMNVGVAFELLTIGKKAPLRLKGASGHIVFDVKMDFI